MKGPSIEIPPSLKSAVVCMLIVSLVVTWIGVGHVASRQKIIRLGYELTDSVAELQKLLEENRRLRLERSVLTNPERIERLARAVGMERPTTGQVRVVKKPHVAKAPSPKRADK